MEIYVLNLHGPELQEPFIKITTDIRAPTFQRTKGITSQVTVLKEMSKETIALPVELMMLSTFQAIELEQLKLKMPSMNILQ